MKHEPTPAPGDRTKCATCGKGIRPIKTGYRAGKYRHTN